MRVHFSPQSDNAKTGRIGVSTSPSYTCPPSCGMYDTCYAKHGPLSLHWNAVSIGERGDWWPSFLKRIKDLPPNEPWRHNQAGDLPGYGDKIDQDMLSELVDANSGKRGWTYTHKPLTNDNAWAISCANVNGFTINLSADTMSEADDMADCNCGPVVVVVPRGTPSTSYTPKGRKVVLCPAQYRKGVTCESCLLCQKSNRSVIVGFVAHGTKTKKAEAICRV